MYTHHTYIPQYIFTIYIAMIIYIKPDDLIKYFVFFFRVAFTLKIIY